MYTVSRKKTPKPNSNYRDIKVTLNDKEILIILYFWRSSVYNQARIQDLTSGERAFGVEFEAPPAPRGLGVGRGCAPSPLCPLPRIFFEF